MHDSRNREELFCQRDIIHKVCFYNLKCVVCTGSIFCDVSLFLSHAEPTKLIVMKKTRIIPIFRHTANLSMVWHRQ